MKNLQEGSGRCPPSLHRPNTGEVDRLRQTRPTKARMLKPDACRLQCSACNPALACVPALAPGVCSGGGAGRAARRPRGRTRGRVAGSMCGRSHSVKGRSWTRWRRRLCWDRADDGWIMVYGWMGLRSWSLGFHADFGTGPWVLSFDLAKWIINPARRSLHVGFFSVRKRRRMPMPSPRKRRSRQVDCLAGCLAWLPLTSHETLAHFAYTLLTRNRH